MSAYDDQITSDDNGVIFRDVITLSLIGIVALVIIMLAHLNPPGEKQDKDDDPPGNLIVEIVWPNNYDTDVDLWVEAPGDKPVGYSNKAGLHFNLLRDDLGTTNDPTPINYENAYTRGLIPGRYTVNVHLYRNMEQVYPIEVIVTVRIKTTPTAAIRNLLDRKVNLERPGQELTVFSFDLNEAGYVDQRTIKTSYKPLRSVTR